MLTDIQIINLGLSKISTSRISSIAPARTPLEAFVATIYAHCRRTELMRRRWVFALVEDFTLTQEDTIEGTERPYKYPLPIDCLRVVRRKREEWVQRGRYIYSAYDTLSISYIRNVPEEDFDPLFEEVLACRVAYESAEFVTQSNAKKDSTFSLYKDAVAEAGKANAFVIGSEDMEDDDNQFSWVSASHHGSVW